MNYNIRNSRGFTIVELLVVIAVIMLLVALLLPAVQMARERARAVECQSRMRQIGLAVAEYSNVHRQFPAGALSGGVFTVTPPHPPGWVGRSVHVALLPYVDGEVTYGLFNLSPDRIAGRGINHTAQLLRPAVYLCPSDPRPGIHPGVPNAYFPNIPDPPGGTWPIAVTHYAFTFGTKFVDPTIYRLHMHDGTILCDGVFNYHTQVTASDVTDGLSKTAFASEIAVGQLQHWMDGSQVLGSWDWGGYRGTLAVHLYPPNAGLHVELSPMVSLGYDVSPTSSHPGGVHVLMGDGSLQFVSDSINSWPVEIGVPVGPPGVWQAMATKAGGD